MRTIKFRAWNYETKGMFFNRDIQLTALKEAIYFPERKNPTWEVMQYTGLKDKNGKEIYEGDIIKTKYNDVYDFATYAIIWDEKGGRWWTDCLSLHHKKHGFKDISKGGYCTSSPARDDAKVIGNIYENPELITQT